MIRVSVALRTILLELLFGDWVVPGLVCLPGRTLGVRLTCKGRLPTFRTPEKWDQVSVRVQLWGNATVSNSQNRLSKFGRRLIDHDAVLT